MTLLTKTATVDAGEFAHRALCDAEPVGRFLEFGVITLDRYEHVVTVSGVPRLSMAGAMLSHEPSAEQRRHIELTRMEFRLLEILTRNAPRPVARDVLRSKLWPAHDAFGTNRLEVLVNQLRKKVGSHLIETAVARAGYRLIDPRKAA